MFAIGLVLFVLAVLASHGNWSYFMEEYAIPAAGIVGVLLMFASLVVAAWRYLP